MKSVFAAALAAGILWAQTPPPQPEFEAVSIHRLEPPFQALGMFRTSGTLVTLQGYTVGMLVAEAWDVKGYQVPTEKLPRELQGTYFSIEARTPAGDTAPDRTAIRAMLRKMLADRFHVTVHKETRNLPVYELVVSKNGPSLKPGTGDSCHQISGPVHPTDRNYRHSLQNCPIDLLVTVMGGMDGGRPVLNKTGLTGLYDILIFFTPEFRMRNTVEPGDISLRDSIRQLGLQLDPRTDPMEVIVIDHAELPTPN